MGWRDSVRQRRSSARLLQSCWSYFFDANGLFTRTAPWVLLGDHILKINGPNSMRKDDYVEDILYPMQLLSGEVKPVFGRLAKIELPQNIGGSRNRYGDRLLQNSSRTEYRHFSADT